VNSSSLSTVLHLDPLAIEEASGVLLGVAAEREGDFYAHMAKKSDQETHNDREACHEPGP